MVYRIHFETKGSYWCIQFKKLFGWETAKEKGKIGEDSANKAGLIPKTFESFEDAEAYSESSGINKAYTRHCVKANTYNPVTSGARSYPVPEGYQLVPSQQ